jgi:hypothetical protein
MPWLDAQGEPVVYQDAEEDGIDWTLNNPAVSLALWRLGEALGWQVPPWDGGFAEWPDWFVEDLQKIHARRGQLEELRKTAEGPTRDLGV